MSSQLGEKQPSHITVATASLIGTAIEWYDFFLYGTAAALIFNKLFFPTLIRWWARCWRLGPMRWGSLRGLARFVFGHYGDKIGRKTMLYLTLLIMGVATAVIGLLPTYETAGIWAPILIACRGFRASVSAANGARGVMSVSMRPKTRRAFTAAGRKWRAARAGALDPLILRVSWFCRCRALCLGLASSVPVQHRPRDRRFVDRFTIAESPEFQKVKDAKEEVKMPIVDAIRMYPKNILLAMGARFAENGFFYIYATFVLAYATQALGMNRQAILNGVLIAAAIESFTIPAFGALSDRRDAGRFIFSARFFRR